MADLNTVVSQFLRDAQYRIGTLSVEISELDTEGSYNVDEKRRQRLELTVFMAILYEGKWYIADDAYNHIQMSETAGEETTWTEYEITSEIQRLRYYTNMDEMPFINFTAHYPQIASFLGTGGSSGSASGNNLSFPIGLSGQVVFYNFTGNPYAETIDEYGGMYDTESINTYFANRV